MSRKQIGFWNIMAMMLGTMIGVGIFMAPTLTIKYGFAGSIACFVAGILSISLAMLFAHLAKITSVNGPAGYAFQTFGKYTGLQVAALHWMGFITAQVITVYVLGQYASSMYVVWCAFAALFTVTLFAIYYPNMMQVSQLFFTITKVALIGFVIILGLYSYTWSLPTLSVSWNNISDIGQAVAYCIIIYAGLELATLPSGNVKNAKVTIPLAIISGTVLCTLIYTTLHTVITKALLINGTALSGNAPAFNLVEMLAGQRVAQIFVTVFVIACISSVNGILSAQAYVLKNTANLGLLPRSFSTVNTHGVPVQSVLVSTAVSALMLVGLSLNWYTIGTLGLISGASFALVYFFSVMSYFHLTGFNALGAINVITVCVFLYGALMTSWVAAVFIFLLIALGVTVDSCYDLVA